MSSIHKSTSVAKASPSSKPVTTAPKSSRSASKATKTSVQHTSTIVSVTVVRPTSLGTETITTHPVSTLSKAMVLTTTNSKGLPVLTTAPFVTIWSTSTNSNGTIFYSTAIVANPQAELSGVSEVLRNTGAVAGIFTVVGVVFAALVAFLVLYIRRRRRSRERERWSAEMAAPLPTPFIEDPFRDENPTSATSVTTSRDEDQWNPESNLLPEGSGLRSLKYGQTFFPIYPNGVSGQQGKPLLQSMEGESPTEHDKARRSQALSVSTPSIYPLSPLPGDEQFSKDIVVVPKFTAQSEPSPPRPPRSHLRDRIKALTSRLPTPPDSAHSNPTSVASANESSSRDHDVDPVLEGKPF